MYKIGQRIELLVDQSDYGFDCAAKTAYKNALRRFGVDENGHFKNVHNSERSLDSLIVEFISYRHIGDMSAQWHEYLFQGWVQRNKEELEEPPASTFSSITFTPSSTNIVF